MHSPTAPSRARPSSSRAVGRDWARRSPLSSAGSVPISWWRAAIPNTSRAGEPPWPTSTHRWRSWPATSANPSRSPQHSTPPRPRSDGRRSHQQRRRQLPRAGRGHVAQRLADGAGHHAQRDLLLLSGARPPAHRGGDAGVHRQRGRLVCLDGRARLRPLGGSQGRREEHGRTLAVEWGPTASRSMAWSRAFSPRRHDRRHPGEPLPDLGQRAGPAGAAGRATTRVRLGRHLLVLALRTLISGHTLVVDGANWQRRNLTNPKW